jgi:F-type H+-transporting ATPase subunit delta
VRGVTVARSYAETLFDIGERHDAHDDFVRGFDTITALLESDPRVRAFLETPKVALSEKIRVLREALTDQVSPLFLNFVLVVLRKRRQRLIGLVAEAYTELYDRKLGRQHVQVILAHEPDEATETEIMAQLTRILGTRIVTRVRVEPAILGGIIVRTGDRILDSSVRRRLIALRRRMTEAMTPAGAA